MIKFNSILILLLFISSFNVKNETIENHLTDKSKEEIIKNLEDNMMKIPKGKFQMGCVNDTLPLCDYQTKPLRDVTISAFELGKYEVTQEEWEAVMGENPSYNKDCDQCPVDMVSHKDIQVFIEALNELTKKKYRLPSEAEWEYAAIGGQSYIYAGGDDIDSVSWYDKNSNNKSHPVGQKLPNGYGLYDMSGNIWEWCQDFYHENYKDAPLDNQPVTKYSPHKSLRGGSYSNYKGFGRAYARGVLSTTSRKDNAGFRLAMDR